MKTLYPLDSFLSSLESYQTLPFFQHITSTSTHWKKTFIHLSEFGLSNLIWWFQITPIFLQIMSDNFSVYFRKIVPNLHTYTKQKTPMRHSGKGLASMQKVLHWERSFPGCQNDSCDQITNSLIAPDTMHTMQNLLSNLIMIFIFTVCWLDKHCHVLSWSGFPRQPQLQLFD